jgi:hydrogenase maturation protein HypF
VSETTHVLARASDEAAPDERRLAGCRVTMRGIVQGVGLRPWVHRLASRHGLSGRVWNDAAGATVEAFGPACALQRFARRLRADPPPAARIESLVVEPIAPEAVTGFEIVRSAEGVARRVSIPPDIATCDECLAEIFDPADRRYRYPFTNCTNCGPRFTITAGIPYDRRTTTMAGFAMCPACRAEYQTPQDRRFHAEPNACPRCGPRLGLVAPGDGVEAASNDPIRAVARALRAGSIVAIKGIGGFHLSCDATNGRALRRLRERKRRDEKPFAVMVRDLAAAERLARLSVEERGLLLSPERPIVLVRRREGCALSREVAPRNPLVGLILPYSPLHHLLMAEIDRPLVMTSGNLSEEPLAYRNGEALARLGAIADLMLVHDREIVERCDDSVARVIGGRPVVLRRSRGYVPRPIALARAFARPVLACGAQLKNTFCLAAGSEAYFGPHIGDLENLETFASYEEAIARMERFTGIRPHVIAHDLHPDYLSSAYARSRADLVAVAVQHHHAHVASAMAEHGLAGPVIGVAYDGTGLGTDGTAWGGEILFADFEKFERMATFRPLALAGGDTAVRQVWRIALAALDDAFGCAAPLEAIALFTEAAPGEIEVVRRMIAARCNAPFAHGVGRYFDAIGALVTGLRRAHYEGQAAMMLEWAAGRASGGRYRYEIERRSTPWQIDLRPAVREVTHDLGAGLDAGVIAARFHDAIVSVTADVVRAAAREAGRVPVVLSGGCFQNARLADGIARALGNDFEVYLHREVPPGDGGIALGQAAVANACAQKMMGGPPCA